MTRVAWSPINVPPGALVVLDGERRLYAALSRDESTYHLIQPARLDDPRVGDGLRQAGQLVCTCAGGTFHGSCYRTKDAERLEAELADQVAAPSWLRPVAPETELERAAARG